MGQEVYTSIKGTTECTNGTKERVHGHGESENNKEINEELRSCSLEIRHAGSCIISDLTREMQPGPNTNIQPTRTMSPG